MCRLEGTGENVDQRLLGNVCPEAVGKLCLFGLPPGQEQVVDCGLFDFSLRAQVVR
jgi:hypothetical protein